MASVLTEVAGETKGQAIVGLISTRDRELTQMFGIRKIPTIFVVRNKQITASFVGLVPKKTVEEALR
jgi:thioredoxin 1